MTLTQILKTASTLIRPQRTKERICALSIIQLMTFILSFKRSNDLHSTALLLFLIRVTKHTLRVSVFQYVVERMH